MTPMEAWRVISANMAELYKRRKTECYKGYTDADIEADVICFNALRQAQNSKDVTDTNVGNKSEWISVEERLPETVGKYLVCTAEGKVYVENFVDYYGNGKRLCFENYTVTHWMPLPEPPKGEEP